jgi:hypothetical protein
VSDVRTSDGRPKLQSTMRDRDHAKVAMVTVGDVSTISHQEIRVSGVTRNAL